MRGAVTDATDRSYAIPKILFLICAKRLLTRFATDTTRTLHDEAEALFRLTLFHALKSAEC